LPNKKETNFRVNKVRPFLKTLRHTKFFPIQQLTIIGDPDFLLCVRGLFISLELKKDKKEKLRKLQEVKQDEVVDAGGISIKADPDNWEEVKQFLKTLDGGRHG